MAADPSIYGQIRPVEFASPVQQYGQAMTLRNLMQQGEMGQLQMQQAQRALAEDDAVRSAYAQSQGDPSRLAQLLMKASPKAYMAQQEAVRKAKLDEASIAEKLAQAESHRFTAEEKRQGLVLDAVARIGDDGSGYEAAREIARMYYGPKADTQFPPQFDPAWRDNFIMRAPDRARMAAQLQQQAFTADENAKGRAHTYQIHSENLAETVRSHRANEATAAGQLAVSQGQLGVSQANLGLSRERLTLERQNADAGRIPQGYRRTADGNLEAIPGGPADPKAKSTAGADKVIPLLDEAGSILKGATGSYAGWAVDQGARALGYATKGAEATARLKAIEGAIMMAQPRMEGPQSNLDVALYRQMAGQIGDDTLPIKTREAAIETVRKLHEKYASPEVAAKPPAPPKVVKSLPDPAANKGKYATDQATGVTYKSDGNSWVKFGGE